TAPNRRVFPNPAADFIVIENFTRGERLRVFSASGLELLGFERIGNVISVAAWPPGLYYLEVTGDETRSLLPFVKMRR
ncbi:MAG TPA: T9SS type A sorting domain-containing protein, partial [Saprospiraceae bacterium]|nr:T9SS type A sorting domain-containing protein [Saprospiraceae bacterium]